MGLDISVLGEQYTGILYKPESFDISAFGEQYTLAASSEHYQYTILA